MTNPKHEGMARELREAGWSVSPPVFVGSSEDARRKNTLIDRKGFERMPGTDPVTGEYSTAQMLRDEMYGGDPSQPLFD